MSEYPISQVYPSDKRTLAQIDALLQQKGIRRDQNLDYICAMFDEQDRVIGRGSYFGNTKRSFAVSHDHQGEGLLNQIISHLMDVQYARGNLHLFLFTKVKSAALVMNANPSPSATSTLRKLPRLPATPCTCLW